MSKEVWKVITEVPRYEVSNRGRVRSHTSRPQILKPLSAGSRGSYQVRMWDGEKQICRYISVLVLTYFVGPCPSNTEAAHNDGDYTNNNVDNLRWATHTDNMIDRIEHGTNGKLSVLEVLAIRSLIQAGYRGSAIARQFRVSPQTICDIKKKRIWTRVDDNGEAIRDQTS